MYKLKGFESQLWTLAKCQLPLQILTLYMEILFKMEDLYAQVFFDSLCLEHDRESREFF